MNVFFTILAAFRLTQVVTEDTIFNPVRALFRNCPRILKFFYCYRCISVWASLVAVLFFVYYPAVNWVFGIAFLYNVYLILIEMRDTWLDSKTPRIVIKMINGNMDIKLYQVTNEQAEGVFKRLGAMIQSKVA